MLVNNPMGSRRRRRFYHRCGVVPGPGGRFKTDLSEFDFFRFEPELHVQEEEGEDQEEAPYHPMMSLEEQEDRENEIVNNSKKATDEDIGQSAGAAAPPAEQPAAPTVDQPDEPAADEAATQDLDKNLNGPQTPQSSE